MIQVGLIAVWRCLEVFEETGEPDAFVRFARMRVKGAMLDELRQMDFLSRGERRKIKLVWAARQRHFSTHGTAPSLGDLAAATGMQSGKLGRLLQAQALGRHQATSVYDEEEQESRRMHPATPPDEVERRVDDGLAVRRLHAFLEELSERERMVIEAYLGEGPTPSAVADSLGITPSRVSQIFGGLVRRIAVHLGNGPRQASVPPPACRHAATSARTPPAQPSTYLHVGLNERWG